MTSNEPADDIHEGRGWLNRAADRLNAWEDALSAAEFARAAATIGAGYIALAYAERAAASSATLDATAERQARAEAEARPHDDKPAPEPVCGFGVGCVLKPDHPAPFHRLANGDDVDSAGRLIDRTRFLGFTSHGHPADTKTVPDGVERPGLVARCGGPGMCHECATDAERLREEASRG